ncbi:MAG TPA: 23S rRNA (adenine(2503)-C(2))-methyltransferase RlmN, partial [Candidatus Avacidaminococcus intestinavium]|nr:23S rRNA (adenine(2503)-C(2))-methyltransferase RlmN [Candidatus Avacidaminococcus intestinavium]
LPDGSSVETVCMHHDYGFSICVSSQVGCNMGCAFCASGIDGLERNLTVSEIVMQVYVFEYLLAKKKKSVSRVVVMGSGEPFHNYDNVFNALDFLHDERTVHLSYRRMTVSTCGIIPGIEKLITKGAPISLAVSLHAATDEKRTSLMPINQQYPLLKVIQTAEEYAKVSGRQVTYEYILIAGINDNAVDAELLSHLLKHKNASVNLIPVNPVVEKGFKRPTLEVINDFLAVLQKNKIKSTIRKEMGKDIDAACGQLRAKFLQA